MRAVGSASRDASQASDSQLASQVVIRNLQERINVLLAHQATVGELFPHRRL